ncbi:MAG: NUDIX hydrolase [Anaerolineae bacterium]|nr:NUDIX hydrolase [Anaerolineae bacterium]
MGTRVPEPPPRFAYCPACGGALREERIDGRVRGICAACGHVEWGNARPCAGALVVRNGKVLLVRRAVEPFRGEWDIPGGFCEEEEHPAQTAVREVREETGLEIELNGLFGLWMDEYRGRYTLNVYYLARPLGTALRVGDDADGAAWFAPDALPARIAFENGRKVLCAWAAGTDTPLHLRGL